MNTKPLPSLKNLEEIKKKLHEYIKPPQATESIQMDLASDVIQSLTLVLLTEMGIDLNEPETDKTSDSFLKVFAPCLYHVLNEDEIPERYTSFAAFLGEMWLTRYIHEALHLAMERFEEERSNETNQTDENV